MPIRMSVIVLYSILLVGGMEAKAVDQNLEELIKGFEGFSSVVYDAGDGHRTIGYGHVLKSSENYTKITERQASILLKEDIAEKQKQIEKLVKVELNSNQKTALISFVYNIGIGAFEKSTMLKKINSGDFSGASNEFDRWIHVNKKIIVGLINRRKTEKELFNKAN